MKRAASVALVLCCAAFSVGAGNNPTAWMMDAAQRWETQAAVQKTLPNGVRLLVVPRKGAPWIGMATVFEGGGASAPVHMSGLPHLAEHLMFEEGGTHGPSSADVDGEAMGLRSNAFTLGDYTVLVEEFSPAVFEDALRIHATRLTRLSFDDGQLTREKSVVADERRFRVDEPPMGKADELLISRLWGNHPWGWPVLGWPHEVEKIDRPSVVKWVEQHIRPERAVVVLVGPVDPNVAMRGLEQALGSWKANSPTTPAATQVAMPPAAKDVRSIPGVTSAYLWAVEASPLGGPHEATDRVIASLLSRPTWRVPSGNDDGEMVPVTLRVDYLPQVHHGEFTFTMDTPDGLDHARARQQLGLLIRNIIEDAPEAAELSAARAELISGMDRGIQSHAARAEQLAVDYALVGKWNAGADRIRAIARVDAAAVQKRLAQLRASARQTSLMVEAPPEP